MQSVSGKTVIGTNSNTALKGINLKRPDQGMVAKGEKTQKNTSPAGFWMQDFILLSCA